MAKNSATPHRKVEQLRSATRLLILDEGDRAPRSPLVDLYEVADGLVVEVDLPGVRPEAIRLTMAHNQLTIEAGAPGRDPAPGRGCYLRMERHTSRFHRVLLLPVAVDSRAATARYERGVLVVRFSKIPDRRHQVTTIPVAVTSTREDEIGSGD